MSTQARDGAGNFVQTLEGAERDREACRLRSRRWTYQRISDALGYGGASNAHRAVKRTLEAIPRDAGEELLALELDQLDALAQTVYEVLEAHHYTVSNGRLIYLGEQPLADHGPVLAAVDRLVKIQERRAKLLGLDKQSLDVSGEVTVRYEVVGVDPEAYA